MDRLGWMQKDWMGRWTDRFLGGGRVSLDQVGNCYRDKNKMALQGILMTGLTF